ncbi:class I tRNA ligase family protein, partial [Mycobacterium tuberculosis]|uniref:class I tRNA ligase family protein n=1 Tax=Mycobacterium tuberculosis TaxID=1773 RepID=UPI002549C787
MAARYRRMTGHDVFFLTGTDEHGQKMEREAERRGITPQALADETAPKYRDLWRKLAISNDDFVRTAEPRHHATVLEIWRRMEAKGD